MIINKIKRKIKDIFLGLQTTYSQTGEDLILDILLSNKKDGLYIDIGSNHPKKFNNTYLFYKKGWSGINIEPNYSKIWLFNFFRRRDKNLNVGVGKNKGELDLYIFRESTLSTFDKSIADEYQKMGHKLKSIKKVPILSLKEIIETNASGKEIDFISIDTEGYDMEVLESNDWNSYRPRFIILETLEYKKDNTGKKLNDTFDPFMIKIGYKKVADTYINSIYEKTY